MKHSILNNANCCTILLVTPLDVVKIRLQAQQKNTPKCYLYCNGLMDHFCGCKPQDLQRQWYARPGHFSGTMVNNMQSLK